MELKLEVDFLRSVLSEAFIKGWTGFKDLQEEIVQKLLDKCIEKGEIKEDLHQKLCEDSMFILPRYNVNVDYVPESLSNSIWINPSPAPQNITISYQ